MAKNYVTYRYTRSLVRRSNTTDEPHLSLIECCNEEAKQENSNKNPVVNSTSGLYGRRGLRDLSERLLLPKEIVEAHQEGIIHFHDSDYFAQHMHNCDLVNLEDMLQNGTVITGTMIERPTASPPPATSPPRLWRRWPPTSMAASPSPCPSGPFVDVSRKKLRVIVEQELKDVGIVLD